MERRFEDILGRPFLPSVWRRIPTVEMGWAPAIEVFEKEDKFVVKAELPGMREEDIDVSVIGRSYRIEGEVTRQKINKTNDFKQAGERYLSLSKIDQEHLVDNLIADLMHIDKPIKQRVVENLTKANKELGRSVAEGLEL